jgi:hypothetical protein
MEVDDRCVTERDLAIALTTKSSARAAGADGPPDGISRRALYRRIDEMNLDTIAGSSENPSHL